jgi:membrane fusion protein, multidrug efflux system
MHWQYAQSLIPLALHHIFFRNMKIRHVIIIGLFLLVNILILLPLFLRKAEEEDKKPTEQYIPHLKATEIINTEEKFQVSGYGTISSFNTVDLAAEAMGKMYAGNRGLKPGIKFKKGDLLFRIDDVELRYAIRARKSSYINLLANMLPDIKMDYSSEFNKWSDYIESIKLSEPLPTLPGWNSDKEKVFLSTRNVLSEFFSIKSQEEQLRKYSMVAPFNGMITDVYMNDLSFVSPGMKVIRVVQTGNYEIPVSIPASQLHLVEIGTKCRVYATDGTEKGAGSVVRISEVINKSTQGVNVYVKPVANEGEKFIEGEYLLVKIDAQTSHKGMRVPLAALQDGGVYVYSPGDSLLHKKTVQVINEDETGAFVTGLADRDVVILQEVLNYSDTTKYGIILE